MGAAAVVDVVRELSTVLAQLGLTEVEVTWGGTTVRVQRSAPTASVAHGAAPPLAPAATVSITEPAEQSRVTVEAPIVGTFYRASAPNAEPYVREGDVVKQGQIVCIIEAMKLMNEIESKVGGRIVSILVENGQPVEYGQPLFSIDPLG
jgi:acetyl-CoA carboxylase biotin carboxyl carrier protein